MSTNRRSSLTPFKSIIREIQDLKDGIGNISKRSFEMRLLYHNRSRSQNCLLSKKQNETEDLKQSNWANMPPELLTDIIQRLEWSESGWPSRKYVVACAAVCNNWREITKQLVKAPEFSGKLTFPLSVKQPGPRDSTMQCLIKRDQSSSTYTLYLGLSPNTLENGKFLLSARKFRRASSSDYIISLDPKNFSRSINSYMGKLRSNFLGTKFIIYDCEPAAHIGAVALGPLSEKLAKQGICKLSDGNNAVAHIVYELNVLGTRGPRRMQCTILSAPISITHAREPFPASVEFSRVDDVMGPAVPYPKSKSAVSDCSIADSELLITSPNKYQPLILKNKAPRWHEQLQCWCLNFRGRVTVASVKNFQLVAATDPSQSIPHIDNDKVLLQFGKIGKDIFTMDYRYPLSAFQAFAVCLSSFDTKLACE